MAIETGTIVGAPLVTGDTNNTFPTHKNALGLGGWKVVETIEDRDAIPLERRESGMEVKVISENKTYTVIDYLENEDWIEVEEKSIWENIRGDQRSVNLMGFTDGESQKLSREIIVANGGIKTKLYQDDLGNFFSVKKNKLETSTDLVNWTLIDLSVSTDGYTNLTYGNGIYIMSGDSTSPFIKSNRVLRSTDLITWNVVTCPLGAYDYGFYHNEKFYLYGSKTSANEADGAMIISSTDGLVWNTIRTRDQFTTTEFLQMDYHVAYDDYIEIGGNNNLNIYKIVSFDGGQTFTTILDTSQLQSIFKIGEKYHGIRQTQGYLYYRAESDDLITWTTPATNQCTNIIQLEDYYILIIGDNTSYLTKDFINFTETETGSSSLGFILVNGDRLISTSGFLPSKDLNIYRIVERTSFENSVEVFKVNGKEILPVNKVLDLEIPDRNSFTTQEILSGGNYNNLEVTADLLVFKNENAQAILNGVWGKKDFHILNLSSTYEVKIIHNSASVTGNGQPIKLPTASGHMGVKGTARVLKTDGYGYFVADTWGSLYRPEYKGLTKKVVQTVDEFSNAGSMETTEFMVFRDAQLAPLSKADLNLAYPDAKRPFQVVCNSLNLIYVKTDNNGNNWKSIPLTTVV